MKTNKQYNKMADFMLDNNIGINSRHTLLKWATLIAKVNFGRCLCNPETRPKCPCPQAIPEINQSGFCTCKLFGVNTACNNCKNNCKLHFTYLPNNQK